MSDKTQVKTDTGRSDEDLVAELMAKAKAEGIDLVGENGLLSRLTKTTLENVLEAEMDTHLGYAKHERSTNGDGNARNGKRSKTLTTEAGPVQVEVPRDRDGSFEPQIVRKRQRRLNGVNGIVLSLSARGLTHGEICAHLAEVYDANVSKQTISAITDAAMERMGEWQNRPLDEV
ncbi:transposase, partial [Nocardiopsis synnemataformans]|uniref:transposase n=1 Tax=Nocardiopsis synnemataformans TaxID=61305 RepID=UPI003EBABB27